MINPAETPESHSHQGETHMPSVSHDHEHSNHDQLRTDEFAKQAQAYEQFLQLFGNESEITLAGANLTPELRAAFETATKVDVTEVVIDCIDDGTPRMANTAGKGVLQIGIGGAGILLDKEQLEKFVTFMAKFPGVKKLRVRSHQGCGAAKLSLKGEEKPVDETAQNFGEMLANKLTDAREDDSSVTHEYVTAEQMTRPEIHTAFGAAVDTTGHYNPTTSKSEMIATENLPKMFNVSDIYENPDHVAANLVVAKNIAFGDHGFKGKFTREQPFVIMLVKDSSDIASVQRISEIQAKISETAELQNEAIAVKVLDIAGFNQSEKAA